MSKRRHKNSQKGHAAKPTNSGADAPIAPSPQDMEDMSAALARTMEDESYDIVESSQEVATEDHDATSEVVASEIVDDVDASHEFAAGDASEQAHPDSEATATDVTSADVVATVDAKPNRKKLKLQKHGAAADAASVTEEAVEPAPPPAPAVPSVPHESAFAKLAEFERLSMEHVPGLPEQADEPGHWRGVGFGLGQRRLVTAFDEVVEIMPLPQITHVPGTQPWMLGVANVRGTLLPVVDLKQFLEGERTVIHEAQRVLVVRQAGGDVAVLIDALYGQRSFNDTQKTSVEEDEGRYGYFIKQMYRVGDNDWGVFSMSMLTRTPEFRQAAA